jgi:hypothetical protein
MSNFRPINRDMDFLMPPSVDEWLPQRHLARLRGEWSLVTMAWNIKRMFALAGAS